MSNDNLFANLKIPSTMFARNDNIVMQGENPGKKMFFLISGELDVIKKIGGIEETIETIKPGGFFGELGLVDRKPRTATIRVCTDYAKIAILDRDVFLLIAKSKPEFLLRLWKKIANWILESEDRLELSEKQLSDLRNLITIPSVSSENDIPATENNIDNEDDNDAEALETEEESQNENDSDESATRKQSDDE